MDQHTLIKTVESLSSLPEVLRTRALAIGERLVKEEDRAELARRMTQDNERIRQREVDAESALEETEQCLERAAHAFARVGREEREARERQHDEKTADERLSKKQHSPPPAA